MPNNDSQWNNKWLVGLVMAGLIVFMGQRALTLDSRVQVLEAEKGHIIDELRDIKQQLREIKEKIDRIDKKVP